MADSISILKSGIDANYVTSDVLSRNLAAAKEKGYTRKEQVVVVNTTGGEVSGVMTKEVIRYVVDSLVKQLRDQQSDVSSLELIEQTANYIQQLHGHKGEQNSLSHDLERCAEAIHTLSISHTDPNTTQVIHQLDLFAQRCVKSDTKLQDMVYDFHYDHINYVDSVNNHLVQISDTAKKIIELSNSGQSTVDLYDNLEREMHELSQYMNINVHFSKEIPPRLTITTSTGVSLLNSSTSVSKLTYSNAALLNPGDPLPAITVDGKDISNDIKSGKIYAVRYLSNTIIKNLREELDECVRQVRDKINALHNEGTASIPPITLTGTIGVPGNATALTTGTQISGQGTLRVGVINAKGELVKYKDIALAANKDIQWLLDQINSSGTYPAGIDASLTSDGRLQLKSREPSTANPTYGITIGSVGSTKAQLCAGTTFDASKAWGVSHFFGLNNLLETDGVLPGDKVAGLTGKLKVRSDLIDNGTSLATARLSSSSTPETVAVKPGDLSVMQDIEHILRIDKVTIPAVGHLPIAVTSLTDYVRRIIDGTTNLAKDSQKELKREQQIYEELSRKAYEVSGVDVREQMMEMLKIVQNQQVLHKALEMSLAMRRALFDIVS
ncbi:MAG: hypothetical protein HYS39_00220 [Proteobacteria bacterium]|nr:hypothetical protein [Pseudomonadota bacterium]